MSEKQLEERLKIKVERLGGLCFKWTSPGRRGVPDRICILPAGRTIFVEMKAPDGKLGPLQRKRLEELRSLGHEAYVLHTKQKVDDFIKMIASDA